MSYRNPSRLALYAFAAGVAAAVALAAHVWITDHLTVLRWLFPLEAQVVRWQIRCSDGAPAWMPELVRSGIDGQASLAGQLAFREPDGRIHHCEHGWRGAMFRSPTVDRDTRFRYASLTKLLTADAVLARVNDGRLRLDARLSDLLPEWQAQADPRLADITVEHLLRHRAGFDRLRRPDPMALHGIKPWCPRDLAQSAALKLDFDPGSRYAYANLGYCLLGVVLERVSGRPFRELMEHEYGLSALGLRFVDGPDLPDEVHYDFRNSPFYDASYARYFDFPALSSSAGLSGSAVGLAQLLGRVAGRKPLNILSRPDEGCDATAFDRCRTLGAVVLRWPGSPWVLYSHGGTLYGMSARVVLDAQGGVLVWLGNGMPRDWDAASKAYLDRVHALYLQYRTHLVVH